MDQLTQTIDSLIDSLFTEEPVAKSMIKDEKPAKETADAAVKAAPKSEKDESRGEGRPKQISDVPQTDEDGEREGSYDKDITEKKDDADGKKKEDSQVEAPKQMVKSFDDAEYAEYQALKKAKAESEQAEVMRKAQKEQADLIKSAVVEATASIREENESLRKAMAEQVELIKSMANKPQKSKAVTNVQAVERFQKSQASTTMSKAELLDVAEELVKSGKLEMTSVIELENTGFIYDQEARAVLEREVKRRGQ
jgi:hypothetical protein